MVGNWYEFLALTANILVNLSLQTLFYEISFTFALGEFLEMAVIVKRHLRHIIFVLMTMVLAGCNQLVDSITENFILPSERNPPAEYAVKTERRMGFTTSDGINLLADVHRPVGLSKTSTILVRIPLTKTIFNRLRTDAIGRFWAARGYTVVVQGTRGRYESGGSFYPLLHERRDGIETLRWLARQSWYDGRLVMWGGSAFGHTQWAIADQSAPGPQALFIQIASSRFRDMFYPGGAFSLESALYWAIRSRGDRDRDVDVADLERGTAVLPILDADDQAIGDTDFFNDWILRKNDQAHWMAIDGRNRTTNLQSPVLLMAGWFDPFLPGQLMDFEEIIATADPDVAKESRLIIGPWGHATDVDLPGDIQVEPYRAESVIQAVPWFDARLGVREGEARPKVRLFVMGLSEWRDENEWPLARTEYTKFYLHSDGQANSRHGNGTLSTKPPVGPEPTDRYDYDPRHPVPSAGGAVLGERSGPQLQNAIEDRADVLVYTTKAMKHPVEITGPVSTVLHVTSDAPTTDFTAKLVDVHPDGSAYQLSNGIRRVIFTPSDEPGFDPAMPREVRIDLWPTSNVFLKGHRIRLEVSSSDFPRFDRNLNTGEPPATATTTHMAAQTVYHSEFHPSYLLLPKIPLAVQELN